jgi:hypothetical protein
VNRGESLKSHRDIEAIGNSGSEEILPLGIAIRDIPVGKIRTVRWQRTQGGPSVGRDQAPSAFGASGNRHFQGQEDGEVPGENPDIIRAVRSEGQVSKI